MGVTIHGAGRRYELLGQDEQAMRFLDERDALHFLRGCLDDPLNRHVLRDLLGEYATDAMGARMDDHAVAARLAGLFASGALTLVERPVMRESTLPYIPTEEVTATPPRPAAGPPPKQEPAPEPGEDTYVAAEDQAAVFEEAAVTGAPVCTA